MGFLKSAFVVSLFTLMSRILGFIRDVLIAKYIGSSVLSDVFFTAFKLPNFFRKIFAEGAFNSAFVPLFSSELSSGKKRDVYGFARNIFSFLLYGLLMIVLLAEIFMPFLIKITAPGFISDLPKFTLTVQLSRITFPYLLFISLVSMMSGVLNSLNKFASVSACPIILNLTFIFSLFLSSFIDYNIAFILSFAVFFAGILQFLWLLFFTLKEGVLLYPTFPKVTRNIKRFFRKFLHGAMGLGIVQINTIIDLIIATLIPGAVSYLYYADRVSQFPLAIIGTAMGTGILPVLSRKIHNKNIKDIHDIQHKALFTVLFLGIPAAFGLFYLSHLIVSVLFERGEFSADATLAVSNILRVYAVGLPGFISAKIFQTIFFARKDTKTPMIVSSICMIINVSLNLLLMKPFGYTGIAIATVISSLSNIGILSHSLMKKKKFVFDDLLIVKLLKIIYCSILMLLLLISLNKLFVIFGPTGDIGFKVKLCKLSLLCSSGAIFYFIVAKIINLFDFKLVMKLILGKKLVNKDLKKI